MVRRNDDNRPAAPARPDAGRDERVGEAIEGYLELAEAGRPPDPEAYAAGFGDLAVDVRDALEGLALVRGLVGDSGGTGPGRPLAAGHRVAGYKIVRELGRGGMGVVYEAVHVDLDRPVALKVLSTLAAPDSTGRRRFLNEAKTAAGLHHTHIVPVFDVGQVGGLCYYAMQRIEGCGLDRVLKALRRDRSTAAGSSGQRAATPPAPTLADAQSMAGLSGSAFADATASWPSSRRSSVAADEAEPPAFEPPRGGEYYRWVARAGRQAADALAYAHKRGVVHRDVKPSNLLVDARGTTWVADFGLARRLADPGLTAADGLLGTPRYMSPEQCEAGPTDGRTDVYGLGATLYEMLCLRPPFDGRTAAELSRQILGRDPVSPRQYDPKLPRDLETIVLKALARRPADRYATAQDLADDLGRFVDREPVRARRIGPLGRAWRLARRRPGVTLVTVAAAATVLVVASLAYLRVLGERDRARSAEGRMGTALKAAEAARVDSQVALREQYLAQAELLRKSSVPDRREEGLAKLRQAAALVPDRSSRFRLRDEAAALLSQRDVRPLPALATGAARGLAYAPGGDRLALLAGDGSAVVLWDLSGRRPAQRVELRPAADEATGRDGPGRPPNWQKGPELVAAGPYLAVIDPKGGNPRLIDPATGAEAGTLDLPGPGMVAIVADPAGRRLVTIQRVAFDEPVRRGPPPEGYRVQLWDPSRTDRPLALLAETRDEAGGRPSFPLVAIDPEGRRVATARYRDKAIALWDAATGEADGTIEAPADPTALAMGPEGLLAVAGGGEVRMYDADRAEALAAPSPRPGFVLLMRMSTDGTLLATAGLGTGVELWDPAAGTQVAALPTSGQVHDLAFAADSRTLVAAAGEEVVSWGVIDPVGVDRLAGSNKPVAGLAFTGDGWLGMAFGWLEPARLWHVDVCPTRVNSLGGDAETTGLAATGDGRLVTLDSAGLKWFRPSAPEPESRLDLPRRGSSPRRGPGASARLLAATADGRTLLVARPYDLLVWRADDPERLSAIRFEEATAKPGGDGRRGGDGPGRGLGLFSPAALSPDGSRLYLVGGDGKLTTWALEGDQARRLDRPTRDAVIALAIAPDGRTLAVGDRDGGVELIDSRDGAARGRLAVPPGDEAVAVARLAFAPTGTTLAVANQRGGLRLWALGGARPEPLVRLPGARGMVTALAFDPTGRRLAVADHRPAEEGPVIVWDLHTLRAELARHGLGW